MLVDALVELVMSVATAAFPFLLQLPVLQSILSSFLASRQPAPLEHTPLLLVPFQEELSNDY